MTVYGTKHFPKDKTKIYGTVAFNPSGKGTWEIICQPHVAIRLKRVFANLNSHQYNTLTLTANPENSYDLAWFLRRYPMRVLQPEVLEEKVLKHKDRESIVEQILAASYIPHQYQMKLPPRPYQATAADMYIAAGGLLVADDVGLGKSALAIAAITDPRLRPAVVVTLAHLTLQWQQEFLKFTDLESHIIRKASVYDIRKFHKGRFPEIILLNYHKLAGWAETLAALIRSITFDEVQELRHRDTAKYSAAQYICSRVNYRLGLSATPIYNYGGEIFNVLDLLLPDCLGDWPEFQRHWCTYDDNRAIIKDPAAFGMYAREEGLMLRRTRKEVKRELPEITVIPHHIGSDPSAILAMEDKAVELAKLILQQNEQFKGQHMQASGEFDMRMRQATGIAKCLAPGTLILKYDGSVTTVEELKVGDFLMGPDSKPRRVLATTQGYGEMFEVAPDSSLHHPHFEPYRVNADHILALRHTGEIRKADRALFGPFLKNDHLEVPVKDFVTKSRWFKHCVKGYKVGVEYSERSLPLDPYFLGLWLGDGSSDYPEITTADTEIRNYIYEFASQFRLQVNVKQPERIAPTYALTTGKRGGDPKTLAQKNPILNLLRSLKVLHHKHIPTDYLINSRDNRLRLLAGLLDSDGCLQSGGYGFSSKWAHLANQIRYLARSLGFASQMKSGWFKNQTGKRFLAYDVTIFGIGLEQIPVLIPRKRAPKRKQIKDPLRCGIKVTSVGPGNYQGFALDGDGLFMLGDFTVTHNSPFVAEFVKFLVEENNEPVVLYGWHRAVYDIWLEKLKSLNPVMFTGSETAKEKEASKQKFLRGESKVVLMSLRAGAGLDGLQEVCHVVVFGELDWSPGVHEQDIGRVHRDGQDDPVTAYYLITDVGSDPVMVDVLGIKKQQIEGMRDPNQDLVTKLQVDGDHIRRLAEKFLKDRGIQIPEELPKPSIVV